MDRPDAATLLAVARETMVERLLPVLPPERRMDGLMIANALGIALRELALGEPPPDAAAERQLVADIRAGRYDTPGPERDALAAELRRRVTLRVAISNPKALDR